MYKTKAKKVPTKETIYLTAIKLFAAKGYSAVSMRDIAKKVGITAASIYNHYPGKEALLDEISERTNQMILDYYDRLEQNINKATSFEQVIDCVFEELETIRDMTVYYGVAILVSEQFINEAAGETLDIVYMGKGINFTSNAFKHCIKKGWVKPFDTIAAATLISNSVLTGTLAYVRKTLGHDCTYDPSNMFKSIKKFMYDQLSEPKKHKRSIFRID